ncbi:hypothetical protein BB561_001114 [Smittium simulii]|uniref:AMP-dependent synthetase/ligase domain-containing protein n=1 Tax=Smittium simulii TaxID=133385 RepID=A0A2T9YW21_9FUNG|nr:hypothetical protein BB561_001114 [Smittium simulii]
MIFQSSLPRVSIPNTDIATFCFEKGKKEHNSSSKRSSFAIVDGPSEKQFNISELEKKSEEFASGLTHQLNLQPDDVVAFFSPNTIFYPIVSLGTIMAGNIITLANPTYTSRELAHQLKDSNSKVLVTQSHLLSVAEEAILLSKLNIPASHIILVDTFTNPNSKYTHIEQLYSFLPFKRLSITTEKEADDRTAVLFYSSGTTGTSKGVILTHKNILTCAVICTSFLYSDGQFQTEKYPNCYIAVLPHYHVYGFVMNMIIGVSTATGIVVVPSFEIGSFLKMIEKYRVTYAHIVPPIVLSILNYSQAHKFDLSSLRILLTGAAPIGKDVLSKFKKNYSDKIVIQAYGMTETSPTVTIASISQQNNGSSGILLSNTEAKVIDENGNMLKYNQTGELCFRGTNVMKGYLNNIEATESSIDRDGFMHTGDVGYVDSTGNYHIVDRIKELIKYKGYQVAPAELESLLFLHSDVSDSAVIGVYDKKQATELPKAFITLVPSAENLPQDQIEIKLNDIKKWVDAQVAPHKKLRGGIQVLSVIPKTASGKILRKDLRNFEAASQKLKGLSNKL